MDITVEIRGLSGSQSITVGEGSTVADVRAAAQLNDGLALRSNGETVANEASTPVEDGQLLVSAPPAAKHGSRL